MKQSVLRNTALVAGAMFVSSAMFATTAFAADAAKDKEASKSETVHLRGVITEVSDKGFSMKTDEGATRKVMVADGARIAGIVPSSLDKVKEGTFIGTANVDDGKGHKALEVVVFPDSMKGTGLGDYAWDLSPSQVKGGDSSKMSMNSDSSMTNGTVEKSDSSSDMSSGFSMNGSTMTNGTVTQSETGDTMQLKVDFGDGSKMITVPKDVPVVGVQKGSMGDIKSGEHVFVAGSRGSNPFQAKMVLVGIDGTIPPM